MQNLEIMAEAVPSTSALSVSSHENNIALLLDKLKEFTMSTENSTHAMVYSKVESKYQKIHIRISNECYWYVLYLCKLCRLAAERNG